MATAGPTPGRAASRAAAFFLAMCLAYHSWSLAVLGFASRTQLLGWSALAVTAVPAAAALLQRAGRDPRPLAGLPFAGAAALALSDGRLRQLWLAATGALPTGFPLRPVQAAVTVAVAVVVAGPLFQRRAPRLVALAATVPLAAAAVQLLPRLPLPG